MSTDVSTPPEPNAAALLSGMAGDLQHQVSETVQSTGRAVTASAEAMQESVETITEAVHDMVRSVSNAFELRRHVETHPWISLGGSLLLGYLAFDVSERRRHSGRQQERFGRLSGSVHREYAAVNGKLSCPGPASPISSVWEKISCAATVAVFGMIEDAAAEVVPRLIEYLSSPGVRAGQDVSDCPAAGSDAAGVSIKNEFTIRHGRDDSGTKGVRSSEWNAHATT
jgi:hypothetical protein